MVQRINKDGGFKAYKNTIALKRVSNNIKQQLIEPNFNSRKEVLFDYG